MVELAMIKLTRPETATDPDALLARLERLERSGNGRPGRRQTARQAGARSEETPDARRQTPDDDARDSRRQTPDARSRDVETSSLRRQPRTFSRPRASKAWCPFRQNSSTRSGPLSLVDSGRCSGRGAGRCFVRRPRRVSRAIPSSSTSPRTSISKDCSATPLPPPWSRPMRPIFWVRSSVSSSARPERSSHPPTKPESPDGTRQGSPLRGSGRGDRSHRPSRDGNSAPPSSKR